MAFWRGLVLTLQMLVFVLLKLPWYVCVHVWHAMTVGVHASATNNVFWTGNYAPVQGECTLDSLETVEGEIPHELSGQLVRNGPNPRFPGSRHSHWFDGDGMLHAVTLHAGTARYHSKWVATDKLRADLRRGRAELFRFGFGAAVNHTWCAVVALASVLKGILRRLRLLPPTTAMSAANINVLAYAGRLWALGDSGLPVRVQPWTLETLEADGAGTTGVGASSLGSQPKVDPVTGHLFAVSYRFVGKPYATYHVVSPCQEEEQEQEEAGGGVMRVGSPAVSSQRLNLRAPALLHDFALTESYAVFLECPLTFRLARVLDGQPPVAFERRRPLHVGVVPRHSLDINKDMMWFQAKAGFAMHTANAWQEDEEVVVVGTRSRTTTALADTVGVRRTTPGGGGGGTGGTRRVPSGRHVENFERELPHLYEWRMNLKTRRTSERELDFRHACEFPIVNKAMLGRPQRYVYASVYSEHIMRPGEFTGVMKFDLDVDEVVGAHVYPEGWVGGACTFVPASGAGTSDRLHAEGGLATQATHNGTNHTDDDEEEDELEEDAGYLVTLLVHLETNESQLLILDAGDLGRVVCRLHIPTRIPTGLNMQWIDHTELPGFDQALARWQEEAAEAAAAAVTASSEEGVTQ